MFSLPRSFLGDVGGRNSSNIVRGSADECGGHCWPPLGPETAIYAGVREKQGSFGFQLAKRTADGGAERRRLDSGDVFLLGVARMVT